MGCFIFSFFNHLIQASGYLLGQKTPLDCGPQGLGASQFRIELVPLVHLTYDC